MAKGGKNKRRRGGGGGGGGGGNGKSSSSSGNSKNDSTTTSWSGTDHAARQAKHEDRLYKKFKGREDEKLSLRERRAAILHHDSQSKIDASKLRLHIVKTDRQLTQLRQRLQNWDDVAEQQQQQQQELQKQKEKEEKEEAQSLSPKKKKKKGRLGPETWKLRGAARPAHEVYDFDTRYVDPHIQAHEEAKRKAKRSRNILALYKGQFGQDSTENGNGPPQPTCREFCALLMQKGMLSWQAHKYKSAREAFLECLECDGTDHPITTARCQLMRLYMESNRPESARRLWETQLRPDDPSVWIRYSAALLEYVSWKLLKEQGSTLETCRTQTIHAIQSNVFCAYQLVYHSAFQRVMEYTDDIQDADADSQMLEEAIEYCHSEQMGAWLGTEGALDFLKQVLLELRFTSNSTSTSTSTTNNNNNVVVEWNTKLTQLEQTYEEQQQQQLQLQLQSSTNTEENVVDAKETKNDNDDDDQEEEEETADTLMYAGMFRTAMDMLEDAGEFIPQATPTNEEDDDDDDDDNVSSSTGENDDEEEGSSSSSDSD